MATEQQTESVVIEPPSRQLQAVRDDLHALEKELVHHMTYATWQRKAERAGDISDAVISVRNARRWLEDLVPDQE